MMTPPWDLPGPTYPVDAVFCMRIGVVPAEQEISHKMWAMKPRVPTIMGSSVRESIDAVIKYWCDRR